MDQVRLPRELNDGIIDCFAREKDALARCSLVCKGWAARSRQHLWREVVLFCALDRSKPGHFLDLLRRSPDLTSLIEELTISGYNEPRGEDNSQGVVFSILRTLSALKVLCLDGVRVNLAEAAVLSSPVRKLVIKRTVYDDIRHLHNFVCAFPCLDDLSLCYSVSWRSWTDTEDIENYAFKVRRLQIGVDDFEEARPVAWVGLLKSIEVTALSLKHIPDQYELVADWFESVWDACIHQIRSLELDLRNITGEVVRLYCPS